MTSLLHLGVAQTGGALWALCLAVGAGCLLTVLSRRLHLPTIVLLLLGGFLLGPEMLGVFDPNALGDYLPMIVSLAVYFIFGTSPSFALLMGSLVIVTGPTVIVPLLRRIRVQTKLGSILHWEGVLIDSIGVFIAILCFEWVVEGGGAVALPNFLIRVISGIAIGTAGGYLIYYAMSRRIVPDNMINAFALASAMLIFGATELIKPEAGLLSVTIAGLIVGIKKPRRIREIKAFKAEIVDLLIGMLFLLLVARLQIEQFENFFAQGGGWVLLSVILLIRPLSVAASAWGTPLNLREKALLSWVAPRGVVAASMASLFALTLAERGDESGDAALLEAFVYSVICATVLIQGLSSGLVAKLLKLQRPAPNDWIIIGAHYFGRELAKKLARQEEQEVILLDTNSRNIALARADGLNALNRDGMEAEKLYEEEQALFGAGNVLALTDNVELNELLMQRWGEQLDNEKVFGWVPLDSTANSDHLTGEAVFGDLSRPAVIGSELLQGESSFESVRWEDGMTLPSGDWHPLFVRRARQLRPIPHDAMLKEIVKEEDEVICLRRSEGHLLRALQAGGFLEVTGTDLDGLYQELANTAAREHPKLAANQILESLGTQEKIFPAFLGHGIAIPHIYDEGIKSRLCYVARLAEPLDIPGQEEPVQLVFFLISPTGDTEGHLTTLADIARVCRNDRLREQITGASDIDTIITAVDG